MRAVHVKVASALVEWAKERGGDLLEKKCWTVACMAHASTGAVALDAPAEVTQVLTKLTSLPSAMIRIKDLCMIPKECAQRLPE